MHVAHVPPHMHPPMEVEPVSVLVPEPEPVSVPEPIDLTAKFRGKPLSDPDRDTFEEMLRTISIERTSILEAMGFALEHAESAPEIVEVITDSLTILKTPVLTKLARLYLVSDILHNLQSAPNGSLFRAAFEETLLSIFKSFREKYQTITGRITQQNLKDPVLKVLHVWSEWCVYSQDQLKSYYDAFLDTSQPAPQAPCIDTLAPILPVPQRVKLTTGETFVQAKTVSDPTPLVIEDDDDLDGVPLEDDDLDGTPL